MPRNGAGTYVPPAGQPVVTETVISSEVFNALVDDIGTEFTRSLAIDGQSTMVADLPMGGKKVKNMADGTLATDGATFGQVTATTKFTQNGTGAVERTINSKLKDMVSVNDFGAIGDGNLHPLSERFTTLGAAQAVYPFVTALTQSIDWAAFQAAANTKFDIYAPNLVYVLNERLDLYSKLNGNGCDQWDQRATFRPRMMGTKGTTLLFAGTPTSFVTVDCVSNCDTGAGVLLNDNYALVTSDQFSGNQYYSLLDYTNADASGATMSTPKQLKVAVRLFSNASIQDLRVQLNYLGVLGYNSVEALPDFPSFTTSYPGLGDNWDIGVLTYNALETKVKDCQVVGYWRMAARAVISSNFGDGKSFGGAWFYDDNVFYQGFVGISIRGNDTYKVLSATTSTITVAWSASHQIPTSGNAYINGGLHTYTGLTYDSGTSTLTLTGFVDDVSSYNGLTRLTMGTNQGFAGASVSNGFIMDQNHFTGYRAYDSGFMTSPTAHPSMAFEISGNPLRNIDFTNIHFFASDVIGFMHSALQCSFTQCYAEAWGFSSSIASSKTKGARYIATPRPDSADIRAAGSSGWTRQLIWDSKCQLSDNSVDMYPMYRPTTANYRFQGSAKWFMPDDVTMDAIGYWSERNVGFRAYNGGTRQYISGINQTWELINTANGTFDRIIYVDASVQGAEKIGFGTTNPSASLSVSRAAQPVLSLFQSTVSSSDPAISFVSQADNWSIRPQNSSAGQFQFRESNTIKFQISKTNGTIFSGGDNTADIGQSGNRFKTVYAATGTINTSDARHKIDITDLSDSECAAAREIRRSIKKFKFTDAVDVKGDRARWHIGVIAQEVISILSKHGLDPMTYAFVCYDEWAAEPEVIGYLEDESGAPIRQPKLDSNGNPIYEQRMHLAGEKVLDQSGYPITVDVKDPENPFVISRQDKRYDVDTPMFDKDGNPIMQQVYEDVLGVIVPAKPAGNIYGIRYEELTMFILSAM